MKDLTVFDCDGVIYRGKTPLPYAAETFEALRKNSIPYRFITNNSSQSRAQFASSLRAMGIDARVENIYATAYATRRWLDANAKPGARIFIVGEQGLRRELHGYKLLKTDEAPTADYVVVGIDRNLTYKKLAGAVRAVFAGATFIATNKDATFPIEDNVLLPGGGTMVAAIERAVGPAHVEIGKPQPLMLDQMIAEAGVAPGKTLLVGDRADTDIFAGRAAGMKTCLVLTGVTTPDQATALARAMRPDFVSRDLRGVLGLLGVTKHKPAVRWKDFRPVKAKKQELI